MPAMTHKAPAKKRAYHHGDLRRALLEAAWRLVAQGGMAALTLREVAREVGVTHAAPYHHFPTRAALLDALAEQAFDGLSSAMAEAARGVEDDAVEHLYRIGRGYTDFARAHPEKLEVMFRMRNAELEGPSPESLVRAGERAFAQLFDTVALLQRERLAPAGDTHELALYAWTIVHGFSKLWVEGPLATRPPYADRYEHMRDVTLRGLSDGWKARAKKR